MKSLQTLMLDAIYADFTEHKGTLFPMGEASAGQTCGAVLMDVRRNEGAVILGLMQYSATARTGVRCCS